MCDIGPGDTGLLHYVGHADTLWDVKWAIQVRVTFPSMVVSIKLGGLSGRSANSKQEKSFLQISKNVTLVWYPSP